jgi:hypothetical protein
MSIVKEFREFFLRQVQVNIGTKKDQETGFPVSYNVGTSTVFNRFLKSHFPNENVFRKLFESITFKLNPEDKATYTSQGLVRRATDAESFSRNPVSGIFQNCVTPEQLTEVKADIINGVGGYTKISETTNPDVTVEVFEKTYNTNRIRREFNIKKTVAPLEVGESLVEIGVPFLTVGKKLNRTLPTDPYKTEFEVAYSDVQQRTGLDKGMIVLFQNGADIPSTYKLCDGTGGTPDLRLLSPPSTLYYKKIV